ncbi:MAG: hypothetical protein U0800_13070 [Isosphaeraceae bacterium]
MRSLSFALFALLACVPRVHAGQDPEPTPTGDLARIQGTWKASSGHGLVDLVLKVQGATTRLEAKDANGLAIVVKSRLALGEDTKPKTWTSTARVQADGSRAPDVQALYELAGDVLRICSNGPGKPRPAEFREGADGLPIITRFDRVKEAPQPPDRKESRP